MTDLLPVNIQKPDLAALVHVEGVVAVFAEGVKGDAAVQALDKLTGGALGRALASEAFKKLDPGEALTLGFPSGLAADAVLIVKLSDKPAQGELRKAGAAIAAQASKPLTIVMGSRKGVGDVALGIMLKAYDFSTHKTATPAKRPGAVIHGTGDLDHAKALAAGVIATRDLVNEPANVLTTDEFAKRLKKLKKLGVEVEVLDEKDLEKLGFRTLLAVGQGSPSDSKVVIMSWNGGKKGEAPFALIGKGVVFDTGGISIKPAAGMEDMTMDMGGAGTVAGVMTALALSKAKANVVALVGLVENMPDGKAQRPGDVVKSLKGDTIEVINTDAEGRLVLADVLWYAQERFKPVGMVDLATLTGAIVIGLGHEMAGVFSNDDALAEQFLKAARLEGEGAWRMPLAPAYDKQLKSNIADLMNVGGRPGGAITAAQFLQRFVKPEVPWIHLDIAGVASLKSATELAPKGATGWGVLALVRMIEDNFS